MKDLYNFSIKVTSLLLFMQAVAAQDCSPFLFLPDGQSSTTCASSMSPTFGPEVGGTVVKIDNGNSEGCPLRSDVNIHCLFENKDGTFQGMEGVIVRLETNNGLTTDTVECISPFSGKPKDVKVSYSVVVKGCETEEAIKFEVDEEFQYDGYRAGLLVDNAPPLAPYTFGDYAAYCLNSATGGLFDEPQYYHIGYYSPTYCLIQAKLQGYKFVNYWSENGLCRGLYICPFEHNCDLRTCLEFDLSVRTFTLSDYDPVPSTYGLVASGDCIGPILVETVDECKAAIKEVFGVENANVNVWDSPSYAKGCFKHNYVNESSDLALNAPTIWVFNRNGGPGTSGHCTGEPSYAACICRTELPSTSPPLAPPSLRTKQAFFIGDTIEIEWNSEALELSASRDIPGKKDFTVNVEVFAYSDGGKPNRPPFLKIQSFNGLPAGSNKKSFVLDDNTISPKMMDWGSNKVAVILVRVVASSVQFWNEDDKNSPWILATRTSKLIGILPEILEGNIGECPILPNKECEHELMPCPPSHDIALEDNSFFPDETCLWPSGNNACNPRLDLEVDSLVTCFNAKTSSDPDSDFCDVDFSELDEDTFDETDGCQCAFSHPMATGCVSNGRTQCCYTENSALITEYNGGAGRPTCVRAMQFEPVGSFLYDTLPYLLCCGLNALDDSCESFLNELPDITVDDDYDNPTTLAFSFGDPHLVTFDGINFNLNGYGEYVAACGGPSKFSEDDMRSICSTSRRRLQENDEHIAIHYRFSPYTQNNQQATVHVGIAIQDPTFYDGTKSLIVILSQSDRFHFYEGDDRIIFPDPDSTTRRRLKQSRSGAKISIPRETDRTKQILFRASITFASGLRIRITEVEGTMNPSIKIPRDYNNFIGLMGQGDGDRTNEFKTPSGARVPIIIRDNTALDEQLIFEAFGKEWELGRDHDVSSLFGDIKHIHGQDFESFFHPSYRPEFDTFFDSDNDKDDDNTLQFRSSRAEEFCAEYESEFIRRACIFDFGITGNSVLVRSTSEFAVEMEVINELLINTPPVVLDNGRLQSINVSVNKDAMFRIKTFDDDGDTITATLTRNDDNLFKISNCEVQWTCNEDYNFITGIKYSQISLTDYCNSDNVCDANPIYTDGAPNIEGAVAFCKSQCKMSRTDCVGFFFQRHQNGHEICGFYQDMAGGKWVKHGHQEGSRVCKHDPVSGNKRCPSGTHEVQFLGSDTGGSFRSHVTLTDGITPVLVTLTVKVSAASQCVNNPEFKIGSTKMKCGFIGETESRRERMCQRPKVRTNCPSSCGVDGCCADSVRYKFKDNNNKSKNCSWINKRKKRKAYCDNKHINSECMRSCDNCKTTVKVQSTTENIFND